MNQKKFIAIHTYHSDETKGQFWAGTKGLERTDTEWSVHRSLGGV